MSGHHGDRKQSKGTEEKNEKSKTGAESAVDDSGYGRYFDYRYHNISFYGFNCTKKVNGDWYQ